MEYKLEKKEDQVIVKIVGDINDGDYVTQEEIFSFKEFERSIYYLLLDLVKNYSGDGQLEDYKHPCDRCDHKLEENCKNCHYHGELYFPYIEDRSCHSLEKVEVTYIKDGIAYDLKLES